MHQGISHSVASNIRQIDIESAYPATKIERFENSNLGQKQVKSTNRPVLTVQSLLANFFHELQGLCCKGRFDMISKRFCSRVWIAI